MKKAFVAVMAFVTFLAATGFAAQAGDLYTDPRWTSDPPRGEAVLADALVGRPAGIVACALGIVGAVVALPFAAIAGDTKTIYNSLVADPVSWTFNRPMGQMYDTPR